MSVMFRYHPPTFFLFFFNDTATTEIYTLSLHDALPILMQRVGQETMYDLRKEIFAHLQRLPMSFYDRSPVGRLLTRVTRSEEHTSELQSRLHLVCRLLLEKKNDQAIAG